MTFKPPISLKESNCRQLLVQMLLSQEMERELKPSLVELQIFGFEFGTDFFSKLGICSIQFHADLPRPHRQTRWLCSQHRHYHLFLSRLLASANVLFALF